ncbi:MAG: DNA methyltransferase [Eubacteriales bacterium]
MNLSWNEIEAKALAFAKKWKEAKDEFSESQSFLNDFFDVFGVDRKRVATFETKVPMGNRTGYIDLLWKGVILIEMKSVGKSLDKAYSQAKDYAFKLEDADLPEYTMVSDFQNIRLYRNTTNQQWDFKTAILHKKIKLFSDLAGYKTSANISTDKEVDVKAAEKMAKLHDILKAHGYEGHQLEVYLVRLLFCMFADDTGIFEKNLFFDYVSNSRDDGSDLSARIARLFEILDTPPEQRAKQTMLSDELTHFKYINGNLFSERLSFADFDVKMRKMLLECCTLDWGYISPAIFGAMFQGVMNPAERRELGAHYTSEENILKVIKPLFLDELWEEFEQIKGSTAQLNQFHEKLSRLKFLDPACGCGNFLIITYRELRRLELEVQKMLIDNKNQLLIDISPYCKVNVNQFYGIEYEEFPCQIAQVGMWLIDHQMNTLVAEHFGLYYARLPLRQTATIVNGNALRIAWESIVPKFELNYILGNPPFIGARWMNSEQKSDLIALFDNDKGIGNLDYVTAWYKKAADFIKNTRTKVAFVSTNSISQGEQPSILWKHLFKNYSINIDFAYRTFRWDNEAKGKAAVHCVIIGFSSSFSQKTNFIFLEDGTKIVAKNINPYLVNAPNILVERRTVPLCDVLPMIFGSMANDGGFLIMTREERDELIAKEPMSEQYIHKFLMGNEFINDIERYCLWLVGVPPKALKQMPLVMERVSCVQNCRSQSKRDATKVLASAPALFGEIRQPTDNYLAVPKVSSEKRQYIPIGFLSSDIIAGDKLFVVPNATLYDFGVLTSNIHMAWVRAVCGRLKSDYSYSNTIVYNNFPWPTPNDIQKQTIEQAAQGVFDARALYPESSLADLYDPLTMPPELVKAHNTLDKAVKAAYGGKSFATEAERVADLMERYQGLVAEK